MAVAKEFVGSATAPLIAPYDYSLRLWRARFWFPLLFAEASPLVQAVRQDVERAAPGHGPNRKRASTARPDLAREQGCSKRALAEAMDGEGQRPVGACRRTSG